MWVVETPSGYSTHRSKGAADAEADALTHSLTEDDVHYFLDELSDEEANGRWMGIAVEYLRTMNVSRARVSNSPPYVIYDVTGLKSALGRDGWVAFLTLLGMEYKVEELTVY